jgi:two-component system, OmpR family, sensor kinase
VKSILRTGLMAAVLCALPLWVAAFVTRNSGRVLHSYAPIPTALAIAGCALAVMVALVVIGRGVVVHRHRNAMATTNAATQATVEARAHEDRRQLLGRIDHEIKNPLTAIRAGLANVAATDGATNGALQSVDAQVVRLARLLGDLRKLSELETREIERVPVDLTELLAEVADATDDLGDDANSGSGDGTDPRSGGGRSVRLTLPRAPWPLPSVPGDRDLLFLAFYNLAANALKFSDPGDVIEIRATDEGRYVAIEVADTGMGIPADEVDAVWGELARGSEVQGIPGSGLGLSFVRIVADRHHGTTQLRSRHGSGTVVRVELPTA